MFDQHFVLSCRQYCELQLRLLQPLHDLASFTESKVVRGAAPRKLAVIGEAAAGVSSDLKRRHSEIEWADISGLGNRVVHGYFSVEWPIIWTAATEEVPQLRREVTRILDVYQELR